MTAPLDRPPEHPICHVAGEPCRYAKSCSERRQRIASGIIRVSPGQDVVRPDLAITGPACVWYQYLADHEAEAARMAKRGAA